MFAGNGGASIDTLKNSVEDIRERSQDVATEDGLTMNSDIGLRGKDAVHLVMQVAPDAYLKTLKKSDTIDVYYIDLEKFFRGELSRRRKRDELPFPDLPANHEKNRSKPRLTTAFGSRVDPDLAEKVDQLIEDRGITKREAFEEAFADLLQKYHR
ncbi:MAG: ribbon-helix-helix protein, CopG family [Pseudomonadota bacterium]